MAETDDYGQKLERRWAENFRGQQMPVSDGTQYVRVGGNGPAVVLLHGFGDTGDMWAPLARRARARTIRSSFRTCAAWAFRRIRTAATTRRLRRATSPACSIALKVKGADLVTHDIGNMVGYAFAAQYPQRVTPLRGDGCAAARHRPLGRDH